jgi:hypothetical protein
MKLNVLDPNPQPWYADGLHFGCTECGNCCTGAPGYVWITSEEISRLANHLNLAPEAVVEKYCRKIHGKFSLKEQKNPRHGGYDCIFLHEQPAEHPAAEPKRTCQIYASRPLQCRTWPFWSHSLASKSAWNSAAKNCPGIGRGELFTQQQIESLRDAKDWPANSK